MLALVTVLGLGGSLAGCADIHPEGDDVQEGMIDSPTDEATRFQEHSAEETQHGDEEANRK
jgi:hypothetical protein